MQLQKYCLSRMSYAVFHRSLIDSEQCFGYQ